jgi:competence CoiA-like predicted nuclease
MNLNETIYKQYVYNPQSASRLLFYADEILIISNRLEELSIENDHEEFHTRADYFREQIMVQSECINELRTEIRENEQALVEDILDNPSAISLRKKKYQQREQKSMLLFDIGFDALRQDFQRFCVRWQNALQDRDLTTRSWPPATNGMIGYN